jgi:hypothetical protein
MESSYTPELGIAICEMIATGDKSLRQVARELSLAHSTILLWAVNNPDFADQYARACAFRDEASMELIDDLRTAEPEKVTFTIGENATKTGIDNGWVSWKKVQIDALKWQLAKRRPKKYGDKQEIEHTGKVTLESLVTASWEAPQATADNSDEG